VVLGRAKPVQRKFEEAAAEEQIWEKEKNRPSPRSRNTAPEKWNPSGAKVKSSRGRPHYIISEAPAEPISKIKGREAARQTKKNGNKHQPMGGKMLRSKVREGNSLEKED